MLMSSHMAYLGLIHVEYCLSHPVVLVFCQNLLTYVRSSADDEPSINGRQSEAMEGRKRAMKRWQVAYTLVRNPQLQDREQRIVSGLTRHVDTWRHYAQGMPALAPLPAASAAAAAAEPSTPDAVTVDAPSSFPIRNGPHEGATAGDAAPTNVANVMLIDPDSSAIGEGEEFHELDLELGGVKLQLGASAC
ncbi:PREDICTED: uncharacterized protein LOC106812458 [Priapulus caudatus]|uniref:Uncharacterized protein LOC106812458 n=1 Tax=Priapulus caudatus TaxID=37621 RepID=A0ABM1EI08_PRICU|nr:PREDICTED: uncharacterized protein LOC106812458 [Priapulus caudatus]